MFSCFEEEDSEMGEESSVDDGLIIRRSAILNSFFFIIENLLNLNYFLIIFQNNPVDENEANELVDNWNVNVNKSDNQTIRQSTKAYFQKLLEHVSLSYFILFI